MTFKHPPTKRKNSLLQLLQQLQKLRPKEKIKWMRVRLNWERQEAMRTEGREGGLTVVKLDIYQRVFN